MIMTRMGGQAGGRARGSRAGALAQAAGITSRASDLIGREGHQQLESGECIRMTKMQNLDLSLFCTPMAYCKRLYIYICIFCILFFETKTASDSLSSGNPRKFIIMVYTWHIPDI
jgi:hypothetical protein